MVNAKQFEGFTLLYLLLVFAYGDTNVENLSFLRKGRRVWFTEDMTLKITCKHKGSEKIDIYTTTPLVINSSLVDKASNRYEIRNITLTEHLFIIKHLQKDDAKFYICESHYSPNYSVQTFITLVFSERPTCTSNYPSPIIFDDVGQQQFLFKCSTAEDIQDVSMRVKIFKLDTNQNITDITNSCTKERRTSSRLSYSCHLDESLNNAIFMCNVTQNLQSSYFNKYQGSCKFGPLHLLPGFSVSISPSIINVQQGDDFTGTTLNCSSNVSGVALEWQNIPKDWEYNVTKDEYSAYLHVYSIASPTFRSQLFLRCNGSNGNRVIVDAVPVIITSQGHEIRLLLLFVPSFVFMVVFLAVCFLVIKNMRKSFVRRSSVQQQIPEKNKSSTTEMGVTTSEPNKNNANNVEIDSYANGESAQTHVSEDQETDGMCVNIIYEPASGFMHSVEFKTSEN